MLFAIIQSDSSLEKTYKAKKKKLHTEKSGKERKLLCTSRIFPSRRNVLPTHQKSRATGNFTLIFVSLSASLTQTEPKGKSLFRSSHRPRLWNSPEAPVLALEVVEYFRLRRNIDSGVRIVVCHPTERQAHKKNILALASFVASQPEGKVKKCCQCFPSPN